MNTYTTAFNTEVLRFKLNNSSQTMAFLGGLKSLCLVKYYCYVTALCKSTMYVKSICEMYVYVEKKL